MKKDGRQIFPGLDWRERSAGAGPANDNLQVRKRAAVYGRHSLTLLTGRNAQSSQQQADFCRIYCETIGLDVVASYSDENISGTEFSNRAGLLRLLKDAKSRRFDVVVFTDMSRFGRLARLSIPKYEELVATGVEVHIVGHGAVTYEVALALLVAAQTNLSYMRTATAMALEARARIGHVVSIAPYGYKNDPNRCGEIVQVPEEIAVIRWCVEEALRRGSANGLAKDLYDRGIRTRAGAVWSHEQLIGSPYNPGMLRNALWAGLYVFGRTKTTRCHATGKAILKRIPPDKWTVTEMPHCEVFPIDVFDRLQAVLPEWKPQERKANAPTFLSGKLRCSSCGSRMKTVGGEKNGAGTILVCTKADRERRSAEPGCLRTQRVERRPIESEILRKISTLLDREDLRGEAEDEYRRENEGITLIARADRDRALDELRQVRLEISHVMKAVRESGLPPEWAQAETDALEKRRKAAQAALDKAEDDLRHNVSKVSPTERVRRGLSDPDMLMQIPFVNGSAELASAVAAMVTSVEIDVEGGPDFAVVDVRGIARLRMQLPLRRPGRPHKRPRDPDTVLATVA